ncbi:MAG TPA: GntR family transcriptional regulator [Candidatus Dormibacteraeota bacterium]|nr:GntR family transcriptional regulator [Candidatus Dormibacteraeota bacterium]
MLEPPASPVNLAGGAEVDRASSAPLWAQVLADLRRRLGAGEFGGRFPTDRELVVEYGVSRHTVREAVRRLHTEGVLTRRRGRAGTTVRSVEFEQPVGTLYSLFRAIEARGTPQTSRVLALELRTDAQAAARLARPATEPLVYLERLRLAGEVPLAVDRTWLPAAWARPLLQVDFSRTALYHELARCCGVRPDTGREQIRPAVPAPAERLLLGLPPGAAVFAITRLTFTGGRPLEWRQSLVRGDRYAFVLEWPQATGAAGATGAWVGPLAADQPAAGGTGERGAGASGSS